MSTSTASSAEEIQQQMQQVRTDLRANVHELVESAREMTVWQRYVQSYPWTCLGAAALVGYLIIPSRSRILKPDAGQMAEIIKSQIAAQGQPKSGGLISSAVSGLAGVALKGLLQTGMSIATQQLNQYVQKSLHARSPATHRNGEADHA